MYLEKIALQNFRNYSGGEFAFEPQGSLIIGPNGSGKTNLLEAIAYCGIGKSIRFHHDEQLLHFERDYFAMQAGFWLDLGMNLAVNFYFSEKKKLLKLDNNPIRQLSSLVQSVKVIYCAPEDLQLINGSPRQRRQYFDLAVSQIFPDYIPVLRHYLHCVEQRNALLRKYPSGFDSREKTVWDLSFCEAYLSVLGFRRRYMNLLNRLLENEANNSSSAKVRYLYSNKALHGSEPTLEKLQNLLLKLEDKEKLYQRTLMGAHLDDYEFLMQNKSLRLYGSQGQKRINVIILKLIQASLIETETGIKPILLFDDIFAELDLKHALAVRDRVDKRYQVLIASPREDIQAIWKNMPIHHLNKGLAG